MIPSRRRYLQAMGIQLWRSRESSPARGRQPAGEAPPPRRAQVPPVEREGPGSDIAELGWEALRNEVAKCTACPLHRGRTQTVFGVGNPEADWLLIGEAPGAQEDRQGEPFVGRAGQLLNAMLRAAGQDRDGVYIANILKCRPPNNRDPLIAEAQTCEPFLRRQIALIQPKLIIALGRIAAHRLLATDAPLARLRGRTHHYQLGDRTIPVLVTYHPAYLLRTPRDKRRAWDDLRQAIRIAEGSA